MSHAAPSCAGFAPRHSTSGVTTQKFGMGEPRSFAHPAGAAGVDEDGKPQVRSANKKEKTGLRARANRIGAIFLSADVAISRPLKRAVGPPSIVHRRGPPTFRSVLPGSTSRSGAG